MDGVTRRTNKKNKLTRKKQLNKFLPVKKTQVIIVIYGTHRDRDHWKFWKFLCFNGERTSHVWGDITGIAGMTIVHMIFQRAHSMLALISCSPKRNSSANLRYPAPPQKIAG